MTLQKNEYGYCVRCKKKQKIQNAKVIYVGNTTRKAVRGTCSFCGSIMYRMLAVKIESDI